MISNLMVESNFYIKKIIMNPTKVYYFSSIAEKKHFKYTYLCQSITSIKRPLFNYYGILYESAV